MSFVICCATREFGVIAADSRATNPLTGEITSEDAQKIIRVNENLIVGYGGIAAYCEAVLQDVFRYNDYDKLTLESLSEMICMNTVNNLATVDVIPDYFMMAFSY